MEMDTDAVISYAAVVEELWPVIEPYLSFTDHVVASKTCRALQKMIIDEDTKKVKMSQFIGGFDYSEGTQDGEYTTISLPCAEFNTFSLRSVR